MIDLQKRLSGLSSDKLKTLAQKLKKEKAQDSPTEIRRQPRDTNIYPLSFEQERLWVIGRLEPDSPAYNNAIAFRNHGLTNNALLLNACLNEIVRRHEILRASFPVIDGQPVQLIAPSLALNLGFIDLRGLSDAEREANA